MAQQAVFTVLQRGSSIAVDEAIYLLDVSDKVESAKKQLMRMQGFLKDIDDMMLRGATNKMLRGASMARVLVSQVRGIAYEVEDIIDTANILGRQSDPKISIKGAVCKYACFPIYLIHLHKLGARIDSANARMKTIFEEFEKLNIAATAVAEPWGSITEADAIKHWRLVHPDFDDKVDVIGFDDQIEQIKSDLLDSGNMNLTVVSIVGLGGAGKSTMAKKVYGLDAVNKHFGVHAWIAVSQRLIPRDLLKEMVKRLIPHDLLKQMIKPTIRIQQDDDLENKTDLEVTKLLHDFLRSKRYLIVLDDVWSCDAWDIISAIFPDEKNGSRIVLTTRNEVVAKQPNARKIIHKPKLLNEEESTQLLLSMALPEYNAVGSSSSHAAMGQKLVELKVLGKDLAAKCCGLPLAIVVLGRHLSRNIDVAEWTRLTNHMHWHALIRTERIIGPILDLSYYDMPSHLRSCFMYITAFPQDSCIDVQVLTSLWVAEGFIPVVRDREEEAIKYVDELVLRCMIQVEKRAISGRITVIKVRDILRHWGIERAQREGFMKDCHDEKDAERAYSEETVEAYRMVLHGFLAREVGAYNRQLRTLLAFDFSKVQVAKSFQGLHHLRVLYLHSSDKEVFLPREIGRMRYLRYLGFGGTCTYHLPSSVGGLQSLETMDATGGRIHHIPGSLWKILTLRHVRITRARGWSVPRMSSQSRVNVMVLSSVADLHIPSAESNALWEANWIMEATKRQLSEDKNPNLSCYFRMTYNMMAAGNQLNIVGTCKGRLRFPNDLLDFEEMGYVPVLKICCANLLSTDQMMLQLGRMKFLRVLEIGERSYTGSVMTCASDSFQCLGRLVLYDLDVQEWKMERQSMVRLMELTLCKCPNLSSLPERLSRLSRLVKLDLIAMPPRCYQDDMVVQGLQEKGCKVFVSSNEKDFQHLDLPIPIFTLRKY